MKTTVKIINFCHKYFGLIIFLQIIVWSFSGFIMYFLDFSDLYNIPPDKPIINQKFININDVISIFNKSFPTENIKLISLKNIVDESYYVIKTDKRELLVDQDKKIITIIPEEMVKKISDEKYTSNGVISKIELLKNSRGNYYSDKPIYKITYNDEQKNEIYINPNNGEVLAKRKSIWSFYNIMWEYHLMKYTSNTNFNKTLLLTSAIISLFVAFTGLLKFIKLN